MDGNKALVLFPLLQVSSTSYYLVNIVLFPLLQSPWSSVTQGPFWMGYNRLWALAHALIKLHTSTHSHSTLPSFTTHFLIILSNYHSLFIFLSLSTFTTMSSTKESSISSITPLTSENYRSWADDMKSWLQLHGLWRLVSGLERKPAGKAEVRDTAGNVVTPAVDVDEDKLDASMHTMPCSLCKNQSLSRRRALSTLDALHNCFGRTKSCDHVTSLGPASSQLHKPQRDHVTSLGLASLST